MSTRPLTRALTGTSVPAGSGVPALEGCPDDDDLPLVPTAPLPPPFPGVSAAEGPYMEAGVAGRLDLGVVGQAH